MESPRILLVLAILIFGTCSGAIVVDTSDGNTSTALIDATLDILTTCYGNRGAIGIVGASPSLVEKLWLKKLLPVVLIDLNKRFVDFEVSRARRIAKKLHVFLFIASEPKQAFHNVMNIWHSSWYNAAASVLVLNQRSDSPIQRMMDEYRRRELFNVNILSYVEDRSFTGIAVWGYNPHTNKAPQPWIQLGYTGSRDDGHYAFWQPYQRANKICKSLDYDKTKDLGGMPIYLYHVSGDLPMVTDRGLPLTKQINLALISYANFWRISVRQMNATPIGMTSENARSIKNRYYTYVSYFRYPVKHLRQYSFAIPVDQRDERIITQFRGNKGQIRKLLDILDLNTRYCVGLTLLVTLVFFKILAGQSILPAGLNVVRMMCNTGFTNLPTNLAPMAYLTCLYVCVVTLHGILAGVIASLLTTEIPVQHPETIDDLMDMNYTIYTDKSLAGFFADPKYEERVFPLADVCDCVEKVRNDSSAACVHEERIMVDNAAQHKLFISSQSVVTSYVTFQGSPWSPLIQTVNDLFLRMFQADIIDPLRVRVKHIRLAEYQAYVMAHEAPPKVMHLKDLHFAFAFLGIGLVCSIVAFVVELLNSRVCKAIVRTLRFFRP